MNSAGGWPFSVIDTASLDSLVILRQCLFKVDPSLPLRERLISWKSKVEEEAYNQADISLLDRSRSENMAEGNVISIDEIWQILNAAIARAADFKSRFRSSQDLILEDSVDMPRTLKQLLGIDRIEAELQAEQSSKGLAYTQRGQKEDDIHDTLKQLLSSEPSITPSIATQTKWENKIQNLTYSEGQAIMADKSPGTLRWLQDQCRVAAASDPVKSRTQALYLCCLTDALEALWHLHCDGRAESDSLFIYDQVEGRCGRGGLNLLIDCLEHTEKLVTQLAVFKKFVKAAAITKQPLAPCATCTNSPPPGVPAGLSQSYVKHADTSSRKDAFSQISPLVVAVIESPNYAILAALELLEYDSNKKDPQSGGGLAPAKNRDALPEGTVVNKEKDYDEIIIPPVTASDEQRGDYQRMKISLLPHWAKPVFYGMASLNEMQSAVYPTVFGTDDNILVSAPTGAGKTNIALLAVLQAVKSFIEINGKTPRATEFKVVYIAPLKSLVTEITNKFSDRLSCLGLQVGEFTGDTPLTKAELDKMHVIVTVPEKWDIQTRNSQETSLVPLKLMIIDEVHLLGEDRGAILEAIVARSFSYMNESQRRHRIIALSATLPNVQDVALFLEVQLQNCFVFGDEFRPIPLRQTLIGVKCPDKNLPSALLEQVWRVAQVTLRQGKQCMVFTHSRNDTLRTAEWILEQAQQENCVSELFSSRLTREGGTVSAAAGKQAKHGGAALKRIKTCQHGGLKSLLMNGIGIHHAGLNRNDRRLVETLFHDGHLALLCTTATLAWGVNLPAHQVVIKGTDIIESLGQKRDLGILDVLQIFGRAGRPDFFDTSAPPVGEAVLVTAVAKLDHYMKQLLRQTPLESSLESSLTDHLNAEIVLGNVNDIRSAAQWLRHTFLFIRMRRNPVFYGIQSHQLNRDSSLFENRVLLAQKATTMLHQAHLIRKTGLDASHVSLSATGLGRVAARYYISYQTVDMFNSSLNDMKFIRDPTIGQILIIVSSASEFEKIRIRDDEEAGELIAYRHKVAHLLGRQHHIPTTKEVPPSSSNVSTLSVDDVRIKVSLLVLMWLEEIQPKSFSLQTDTNFIIQSYGRLMRGFAEVCLLRKMEVSQVALKVMEMSKAMQTRVLPRSAGNPTTHQCLENILAHFVKSSLSSVRNKQAVLPPLALSRLAEFDFQDTLEMTTSELTYYTKSPAHGRIAYELIRKVPNFMVSVRVSPITFSILKIELTLLPLFEWSDKHLGRVQKFMIIFEDLSNILHCQEFLLKGDNVKAIPKWMIPGRGRNHEAISSNEWDLYGVSFDFQVPLMQRSVNATSSYVLNIVSDQWVGLTHESIINLSDMLFPTYNHVHTKLLNLNPLPKTILTNPDYQKLFSFTHFNPIQTQVFHTMYHTDENALVGAPTGSGKTICAEFALFRMFDQTEGVQKGAMKVKCVYVAPLKSLVKERLKDWEIRFGNIGKKVVELSGDITPDIAMLKSADIILTTPEKWDGITRHWQSRAYVKSVKLLLIDEIHLLGAQRGPILEMIVSRTRYIDKFTGSHTRIVGLSTALANAVDIATWLGVDRRSLFNFRPSVRPVPCTVYLSGFSEPAYCKRMATMNKPIFNAILEHSPKKPVMVFVSSRRQVRLTGKELVFLCKAHDLVNSEGVFATLRFLNVPAESLAEYERRIDECAEDEDLKECLKGGVALHHAGLSVSDRQLSEELFLKGQVQILVATSTLAWGVNLPAHLVVVKGTEFYDVAKQGYVDFPITDLLQMIGRAGRPQFDSEAHACVLALEEKKNFYRRFLYEPFPVESSLHQRLADHLNAFVVSGNIQTKKDAFTLISYTYLYRRLLNNISYYDGGVGETEEDENVDKTEALKRRIVRYLDNMISDTLEALQKSGCIKVEVESSEDEYLIDSVDRELSSRIHVQPTALGRIACLYYVSHQTVATFARRLLHSERTNDFHSILRLLCNSWEIGFIPVRHAEDEHNGNWNENILPLPLDETRLHTGHEKAMALFQMHMWNLKPPVHDYYVDCKSLLSASVRLIQALADVSYEIASSFSAWQQVLSLYQCLSQGTNPLRCNLYTLPHMTKAKYISTLQKVGGINSLAQLLYSDREKVKTALLRAGMIPEQWQNLDRVVAAMPRIVVEGLQVYWRQAGDEQWTRALESDQLRFSLPSGSELLVAITSHEKLGWRESNAMRNEDAVYAPRWPRSRTLNYWVGLSESDELIHFRRMNRLDSLIEFVFTLPPARGANGGRQFTVTIAPDCFVGLDRRVHFSIEDF